MTLYGNIILNLILIVFPLNMSLLYQIYQKNIDIQEKKLALDIALVSILYLLVQFNNNTYQELLILMINVPLILAYVKNRKFTYLFMVSAIILYHYYNNCKLISLLIIEYLICFIYFIITRKNKKFSMKNISIFILLKTIISFIDLYINHKIYLNTNEEIIKTIMLFVSFISTVLFVIILFNKSEEIINYHMQIKDLEKEKEIRKSLFKITHEIKNPIAVAKGYLDMFDINNIEHSRKYVPILKEEINNVLNILQDFLSITKIKIEKDLIDINYLLEETIKSLDPLLKEKKIIPKITIPKTELYIEADYNRLNQVLINIIKNSVEAKKEENSYIKIYTKKTKNTINIYIEDNGIGISKENLEKMQEPFFTTKTNGTGLGVYLSREIIIAHGGTIEYKSEEGIKTLVKISLPMKKGAI